MSKKPKPIFINDVNGAHIKIEFCHRQYIRLETDRGGYLGSIDCLVKFGRRDVKRLRDWCDQMLFDSSAAGDAIAAIERKK